jgi:hypothetical protein
LHHAARRIAGRRRLTAKALALASLVARETRAHLIFVS